MNLACFQTTAYIRSQVKSDTILLAGDVIWRNARPMKKVHSAVAIVLDAATPFLFIK
jgi:hypothetical protein